MATLDVRKILGPKDPTATRQVTLSKSWCDYHKLRPGTSVYLLTDGPFTVVVPGNINIDKAKEALEELVRKYNGAQRPPPTTVKPKAPRRAPQAGDSQSVEPASQGQNQAPAQPEAPTD